MTPPETAASTHPSNTKTTYTESLPDTKHFTKVTCGAVYPLTEVDSNTDISNATTSPSNAKQFGVIIRDNTDRDRLLLIPVHAIKTAPALREKLFNNGTVWLRSYTDGFTTLPIPKHWGTMILPDKESVSTVIQYTNQQYGSYTPSDTRFLASVCSLTTRLLLASSLMIVSALAIQNVIQTRFIAIPSVLLFIQVYFSEFSERFLTGGGTQPTEYIWGRREDSPDDGFSCDSVSAVPDGL